MDGDRLGFTAHRNNFYSLSLGAAAGSGSAAGALVPKSAASATGGIVLELSCTVLTTGDTVGFGSTRPASIASFSSCMTFSHSPLLAGSTLKNSADHVHPRTWLLVLEQYH